MTHHYATPGVYIEEVTGPGAIAGVGTSTAGFIGPALNGPINEARYITSWDEFQSTYGRLGADGRPEVYITSPRHFYMAHAVRGFFENGGHYAYIVRVGTARRAYLDLADVGVGGNATGNALHVEAQQEGLAGNNINVEVQHVSLATALQVSRPTATITTAAGQHIQVDNAAGFRPGDTITRAGTAERQVIDHIDYASNEIFLQGNLVGNYNSGTLELASLQQGQRTFRLDDTTGLFPGSVVTIEKGALSETATLESVREGFITLEKGLANTYTTEADITVTSHEFTLIVTAPGAPTETFANLAMNRRHPRFYAQVVRSNLVQVAAGSPPPTALAPNNRPAVMAAPLAGGLDDDLAAIGATEYQDGIAALVTVDDVNLLCMPDVQDAGLQGDLITHCLNKGDRFAILDVPAGLDPTAALNHRSQVESERGFAALYYPWLEIRDPSSRNGDRLLIPSCGHVAGVYARVDEQRGVHKAPANEMLRGAVGLERVLTNEQQAQLNTEGVNALRVFPGQARPVIWGARTTVRKDVTDWRYVNVRRLMLFLEESIEEGIRWAVFEPNNLALWQKLKRTIGEFLMRVWRDGALFGETAEQAFYVRIDEALNPPSTQALGRLYIEIGVRPAYPAEFIIVRIGLWQGGAEISEG